MRTYGSFSACLLRAQFSVPSSARVAVVWINLAYVVHQTTFIVRFVPSLARPASP